MNVADLHAKLREHGVEDIRAVRAACMESDGEVSVITRRNETRRPRRVGGVKNSRALPAALAPACRSVAIFGARAACVRGWIFELEPLRRRGVPGQVRSRSPACGSSPSCRTGRFATSLACARASPASLSALLSYRTWPYFPQSFGSDDAGREAPGRRCNC